MSINQVKKVFMDNLYLRLKLSIYIKSFKETISDLVRLKLNIMFSLIDIYLTWEKTMLRYFLKYT